MYGVLKHNVPYLMVFVQHKICTKRKTCGLLTHKNLGNVLAKKGSGHEKFTVVAGRQLGPQCQIIRVLLVHQGGEKFQKCWWIS